MRRFILAAILSSFVGLSGCTASDFMYNMFGVQNSDQSDLRKVSKGNQFAPPLPN